MPYYSCTIPWTNSGGYPRCTGTSEPSNSLVDTANYSVCDTKFSTRSNNYLYCSNGIESKQGSELKEVDFLFQADSYTSQNGYIRYPINLTNTLYDPSNASSTEDQQFLNDLVATFHPEMMASIVLASMTGLAIGFASGLVINTLRKGKNIFG